MTLSTLLEMEYPIIQAPMAGVTTPEFVVASAEAGILPPIGSWLPFGGRDAAVYSRSDGEDG